MQRKLSPSKPYLMYNSKVVNTVVLLCNCTYFMLEKRTKTLLHLLNSDPSPLSPALVSHHSVTLPSHAYLVYEELFSICACVTGLFHLSYSG